MSSTLCLFAFLLLLLLADTTLQVTASASSSLTNQQPHFHPHANGAALAISAASYTTTQFVIVSYGGGFGYPRDWFGIYLTTQTPGATNIPGQTTTRWAYASGTMIPPTVGSTNGTVVLAPVNTAGSYFLGWFINDTYLAYTPFITFNVTTAPTTIPSTSSSSSSSSTGSSSNQFNNSSSSSSSGSSSNSTSNTTSTSSMPVLQTNALLTSSQSMLSQWWIFIVLGVAGIAFVLLVLGAMVCIRKRFAAYKVAKAAEKELMVRSLDGLQTMARKSMA